MSFQVCIKTEKPLHQLATEMRDLFSLPPFKLDSFADSSYCQFEMLGMLILIRQAEEVEREPEVADYPYCFDIQMSFTEHELDTDTMEYALQPYYAQLIAFHLGVETACQETKRVGEHWQIRYNYYVKNKNWSGEFLFGEKGWSPAVISGPATPWRLLHPALHRE
ncbi:hypothetical protein [Tengunoibacter tsumagoiensis]|uniref:Uncharacterized protein n=1 Tax=Tengunoibacter tsumagoiensis TaxID=2014871 RepID=A0A401ZVB3_9CHLR|nr:hypothetical protein [Tengunoibacter tsumagoiensis]GCE10664.1 hypothetical protein KTT_05230 [Tengunoibacter tsumagoiensis]